MRTNEASSGIYSLVRTRENLGKIPGLSTTYHIYIRYNFRLPT